MSVTLSISHLLFGLLGATDGSVSEDPYVCVGNFSGTDIRYGSMRRSCCYELEAAKENLSSLQHGNVSVAARAYKGEDAPKMT